MFVCPKSLVSFVLSKVLTHNNYKQIVPAERLYDGEDSRNTGIYAAKFS